MFDFIDCLYGEFSSYSFWVKEGGDYCVLIGVWSCKVVGAIIE